MLSHDYGRRAVHDSNSKNRNTTVPQWISDDSSSCILIALTLPYYYYYYYCRHASIRVALYAEDHEDDLVARIPRQREDDANSIETASTNDRLLHRQTGLHCCA